MLVCAAGSHKFDADSGWCSTCGRERRDGFLISTGGHVLRKPRKSASELLFESVLTESDTLI